jgi:hypothetical protein
MAKKLSALALPRPDPSTARIIEIRGQRIVLDFDLAVLFGVDTGRFNQAIKRNRNRFPAAWAFQLTDEETANLKSQSVIASDGWGGRRKAPWAFTEHGVVMAASVLKSETADTIMQLVVDVFVRARKGELKGAEIVPRPAQAIATKSAGRFSRRIQRTIEKLMDAIVDHEDQRTVRDEAMQVFQKSISHIKSKLDKAGFENEEIAARATKLLAEAEASRATAAKTKAEADEIALRTLAKKLQMVLEAERAMAEGQMLGFLKVLGQLSKA